VQKGGATCRGAATGRFGGRTKYELETSNGDASLLHCDGAIVKLAFWKDRGADR